MDVLGTTLLSVGSALAASMITGWFAFYAGARQAEAARYAGSRQADALLATVRMTLGQQQAERMLDSRRQTYLDFIAAADAVIMAGRAGGAGDRSATLQRALGAVQLEGPAEAVRAAGYLLDCLRGKADRAPDDQERARQDFIDAARAALASVDSPPS